MRSKKQTLLIAALLLALSSVLSVSFLTTSLSRAKSDVPEGDGDATETASSQETRGQLNRGDAERTQSAREPCEAKITKKNIHGEKWKSKNLSLRNSAILRDSAVREDAESALERRVEEFLEGEHRPHQVLVRFLPDTGQQQIDAVIGKVDPVRVKQIRSKADAIYGALYQLYLGRTATVADALKLLLREPALRYAEPNYIGHLFFEPNDFHYVQGDLWGVEKIGAAPAWDMSTGGGVLVAVVDTGCDYAHEDLADNIWTNPGEMGGGRETNLIDDDGNGYVDDWRGWNFPYSSNDPYDGGSLGHGTHVSGTVAAIGDNSVGVVGVAFNAKIMAVKALDDTGHYDSADMAGAITYAVDNGAQVINISAGGGADSSPERDAAMYAYMNNCITVAAAGNHGSSIKVYPAAYSTTIAAGSTNEYDVRNSSSAYGYWLDVMAPGSDITSTRRGGGYVAFSGTSMASPHVAGLAALLLSKAPGLTVTEVRDLIRSTAVDLGATGPDDYYAYGRIDAVAALDAVGGTLEPVVTIILVEPDDNVIGPFASASITWESNRDATFYIEVGGDGTPGSGSQIDTGSCVVSVPIEIAVYEVDIADNTTQNVYIIVEDGAQTGFRYTPITDDHITPVSSISLPSSGSTFGSVANISGIASDAGGSSVTLVRICIFDGTSYCDHDGEFGSSGPVWLTVSGTTSWFYEAGNVAWRDGLYTITSSARDTVGNVEMPGAGVQFTFDRAAAYRAAPKKSGGGCALTRDRPPHSALSSIPLLALLLSFLLLLRRRRSPGSPDRE